MSKFVALGIAFFFSLTVVFAADSSDPTDLLDEDFIIDPVTKKSARLHEYKYIDKDHTTLDNVKNVGALYGLAWVFYPIVQPKVFNGAGGWRDYKRNFGKVVFDKDEPFWNFFVHPLTGSQLYLLYRANGYTRMSSFGMTFVTSALFEFTVEIFTEPASVQDLYQTPVLGTVIGLGIENLSMYCLNSGTTFGKIVGHLINPATLFPFYEGRTLIIPSLEPEDKGAMMKFEVNF